MTKPLNTLQAGRAVAAIAVLFYHLNLMMADPKFLGREIAPIFRAANSGVSFFFVLSGFVIFLAHRKDMGRPSTIPGFFWKRFRRIYPPLWMVLALLLVAYFVVPSLGSPGMRSFGVILSAFAIAPHGTDLLLGVEWTLRHEVVFYALFAFVLWNRKIGWTVLGVWMLICAGTCSILGYTNPAYIFSGYNLLFGIGILVGLTLERWHVKTSVALSAVVTGGLITAIVWVACCLEWIPNGSILSAGTGLGAGAIILGMIVLERADKLHSDKILVFLGEASYAIYLVHVPAISLLSKLVLHTALSRSAWLCFVIIGAGSLVIGVLFHILAEKPVLNLLRMNAPVSVYTPRPAHVTKI